MLTTGCFFKIEWPWVIWVSTLPVHKWWDKTVFNGTLLTPHYGNPSQILKTIVWYHCLWVNFVVFEVLLFLFCWLRLFALAFQINCASTPVCFVFFCWWKALPPRLHGKQCHPDFLLSSYTIVFDSPVEANFFILTHEDLHEISNEGLFSTFR